MLIHTVAIKVEIKVEMAKEIRMTLRVIKFLQMLPDRAVIQGRILHKKEGSDRLSPLIFSSSQVPTTPGNHSKNTARRRPTMLLLFPMTQLLNQPSHLLRMCRLAEKLLRLLEEIPDPLRLIDLSLIPRRS